MFLECSKLLPTAARARWDNTDGSRNPLKPEGMATMDRTELAAGEIVGGTVLAAWLVKPDNGRERVMIIWPDKPS
jgi:hypothetical protein